MTFGNSIKTCFKKYACFNGRAKRSEYWWFCLFVGLINVAISYIVSQTSLTLLANCPYDAASIERATNIVFIMLLIECMISGFFFLPSLAAGVRRCHDLEKSGWYILIPIYNLILMCTKGVDGRNEYGEDPSNNGEPNETEEQNTTDYIAEDKKSGTNKAIVFAAIYIILSIATFYGYKSIDDQLTYLSLAISAMAVISYYAATFIIDKKDNK